MKKDILQSIMDKCKSHKPLTCDEYDKLGMVLNTIFGDPDEESFLSEKYPINLVQAIFGASRDIYMTDEKSTKEIEDNIEYVLNNTMEPDESCIIKLRFKGKMSLEEIGDIQGKTRERIRQIEARALRKLRHPSRTNAIFSPYKLNQEIKERTNALNQKNLELASNITKCLNQIDILANALEGVGIKVSTEKSITEVTTLARNIDEFGFSVRAFNCMRRAGIMTIGDLTEKTENEMKQVRNLGHHALEEIKEKLLSLGLRFMTEEERKLHPIHTRDEIQDICKNCNYEYHGSCRRNFEWDEDNENHCKNFDKVLCFE